MSGVTVHDHPARLCYGDRGNDACVPHGIDVKFEAVGFFTAHTDSAAARRQQRGIHRGIPARVHRDVEVRWGVRSTGLIRERIWVTRGLFWEANVDDCTNPIRNEGALSGGR